jgi:hypothetical protein
LWTKPSIEVVPLQSAEGGVGSTVDGGHSAHYTRPRS